MLDSRRVTLDVKYNGVDISEFIIDLIYTDSTDSTDDISITLADKDNIWYEANFPETGDVVTASIILTNWNTQGDTSTIDFGSFEVDNIQFSDTITINAVAVPISSSIRSEEKTRGWENLSLSSIAAEIANNSGLELIYQSEFNPFYDRTDQQQISDLSFLEDLCKSDGLCIKISDNQLIIYEERLYDELPSVDTIERGQSFLIGYPRFKRNAKNIYKACQICFTDPDSDITHTAYFEAPNHGNVGHVLRIVESFNSRFDGLNLDHKARARLREQNKNEWTLNMTLCDSTPHYSGTNLDIVGWFKCDGKYHITQVSYNISSSGFSKDLSLRRCLEGY